MYSPTDVSREEYEDTKRRFEETRAYCEEDGLYHLLEVLPHGTRVVQSLPRLSFLRLHGGGSGSSRFVEEWMRDPSKRTVSSIVSIPPPREAPEGSLNCWGGFEVERLDAEEDLEGLLAFLEVANHVSGGSKERLDYLLDWVADIFVNPATKTGVAMVLCSQPFDRIPDEFGSFVSGLLGAENSTEIASPLCDLLGESRKTYRRELVVTVDDVPRSLNGSDVQDLEDLVWCEKPTRTHRTCSPVKPFQDNCRYLIKTDKADLYGKERFVVMHCSGICPDHIEFWERTRQLLARPGTKVAVHKMLIGGREPISSRYGAVFADDAKACSHVGGFINAARTLPRLPGDKGESVGLVRVVLQVPRRKTQRCGHGRDIVLHTNGQSPPRSVPGVQRPGRVLCDPEALFDIATLQGRRGRHILVRSKNRVSVWSRVIASRSREIEPVWKDQFGKAVFPLYNVQSQDTENGTRSDVTVDPSAR
jgi:hypothetical protein